MSIVPIFFRNWWDDEWDRPLWNSRLLDQHFGGGVTADDLLNVLSSVADTQNRRLQQSQQHRHPSGRYVRPWHSSCVANKRDSGSTVNVTNDKFQINLDVQQFAPEEISVKYVDKSLVVEGKHEEKQDEHGYISRHFVRRYTLPAGHNENQIESSLSSDGILTITCPRLAIEQKPEKTIPITQTGQPQKTIDQKKAEDKMELQQSQQHRHPSGRYVRPWHSSCVANKRDSGSTVNVTNDKFQINLDVQQFAPEEISVKYVDKSLVVEGKHEEKQDEHGYISRHFVRRYTLPAGHNENQIESSLSSDGILTITCPRLAIEQKPEKTIPITQTGQPLKILPEKQSKENHSAKPKEGEKMES
ncbi:lethal(2)essential for life protein, l2efl [Anopheles darlingi]|uniref:Lethal(2)essential for life protein, l2efl n=1 Tax=Anopheles darlingi TaxID=43151 RepID=W5JR79_ANODA|nr:lethal(2)essential for life protein, l2efl [Anopheles darlingi]